MKQIDPMKIIDKYIAQPPVPVYDILRELGLGPEFRSMKNEVSGWIERGDNGRYTVVINSNHASTRQRFTAAHELAHFIYHRDLLGEGVGDNRAYRAEGTPFKNEKIQIRHERQANSVAANILMPKELVYKLKDKGITDTKTMASLFGVSEDAMRIRLGLPKLSE
jgi:predicted transcriptional regulator